MNNGKKEQVRDMFDAIAWRYDRLNHILSFGVDITWRRKLVRMVRRSGAREILDVATGTGDLAIMMGRRIAQARITGGDISEGMLEIGRAKVAKAGLQKCIKMQVEDAEALSFNDLQFDAVTAVFGVRNFADIPKGVKEMQRVLRPGGRIYVMEFGVPENKIFGAIYRFYFHNVLPRIGRLVSKDLKAYTYLPQSVDSFPYGERFIRIMEEAELNGCGYRNLFGGVAQIYYGQK